jgi:hypothetical protein
LPTAGIPPWEIPAGAFGSQRLYRVSYSGPEGEGSFRVTLRLVAADHYQVQAVDPVGRSLWSLDVSGGRGLSLNHRARTFCAFEGSFDLSGVSLGPFPLLSLPAMLLGRVPAVPAEPPKEEKGGISFHDGSGRRWSATVGPQGVVESWTLWEDGGPAAWWIVRDNWSILSERSRGRQVRWREVLREALTTPPAPLQKPTGFREECEAPTLEDGAGGTPPPPG